MEQRGGGLAGRAVRGAVWTVVTSVAARAVGVGGTLLLTRYLDPGEYGEVSLAAVVILTANVVSSCGLSQYLVSKPTAGRAAAFHATFYFTLLGLLALGVALAVGGPFGRFINAPGVGRFLPGLALAAVLERAGTIQDRIQVRDMRFRSVGLQRSIGEVVYSGVSVILAARGAGRWWGGGEAVVLASIARSAVRLLTLSATTERRAWLDPCRITWEKTRELFAFGLPMSVATLAGLGSRRWDNFVFSAQFGQAAAGTYNLAYNVADIPATQIADTIGDVLVPSFAEMDSDARRRRALTLSMRQMTLMVSPLAVGLGAVAPTLVATFLDRRWAAVAPALTILSGLSVVRPISWIASSYLQVEDRPRTIMIIEGARAVLVLVLMFVFGRYAPRLVGPGFGAWSRGEHWACASVGVTFGLGSLGYLWALQKAFGISVVALLREIAPPIAACVPMAIAVVAVQRWLAAGDLRPGLRLALEIATGVVTFVPSARFIARRTSLEFLELVEAALARRPHPPTPLSLKGEGGSEGSGSSSPPPSPEVRGRGGPGG